MNQNTQHLAAGTMLGHGKYRIVRFIGAGGFGCTYEAEFVPMRTRVAIKEFFVSSCCNREASGAVSVGIVSQTALVGKLEEKFRREAKRLFKMQHPNIVRVSDIIVENGTSYYVMDYISGRSLQSVIDQEGPLPEARALRYIGQVMDALEYVHGKSMLHLDIKPDNIMIDAETDRAILIDFGVSKQYDEADGHNTSTIMGQTPGYAPPEQAGNSIRQFTPAADIYALGATLYTALTGMVPPCSTDLISEAAELEPLPAGTTAATQKAIAAMMQPSLKRRIQTVAAARALLGTPAAPAVNAGPRPVAPADSDANKTKPMPPAPEAKPKRKPKKWLWVTIAAIVIIGGLAAFILPGAIRNYKYSQAVISSFTDNNPHEWVDMGTSVKWATCNVGASSPTDAGVYFAWGETKPKVEYIVENNQTYDNENIGSIAGDSRYDAARANWGGGWRMPTKEEFQELIDKCTWEWNDAGYYVVTAKNGNVLYLPAAGWQYGSSLDSVGSYGIYWSATPDGSLSAWYLSLNSDHQVVSNLFRSRHDGRSVRPVLE